MRYFACLLAAAALWASAPAFGQEAVSIAQARKAPQGSSITVAGVVLNGDEFGGLRFVWDGENSIGAYSWDFLKGIARGDSVRITGKLNSYHNLLQLDPIEEVAILGAKAALPEPKVLPLDEALKEAHEGELVRFQSVRIEGNDGLWEEDVNYVLQQESAKGQLRIRSPMEFLGAPLPEGDIHIIGIVTQYKDRYQLIPRDEQDLVFTP